MTGISTSDLAGIQATVTSLLPDLAQIQRATLASDGAGGQTGTPTTIATVPCMVNDRRETASETVAGERVSSTVEWVITLPAGTDVTARDRIIVGTRTFQVTGVLAASYETDRRVVCREANP